jgi:hypothetical protein
MKYLVTIKHGRQYIVEATGHDEAMDMALQSDRSGYAEPGVERSPNGTLDTSISRYSEGRDS